MKRCGICGCNAAPSAETCVICGVRLSSSVMPSPTPSSISPSPTPSTASVSVGSLPAPGFSPFAYPLPPFPVEASTPLPKPLHPEEEVRADRKAIAGFALSLLGIFTCIAFPLNLLSLGLCISARKTKRHAVFRVVGGIFSTIALIFSATVWVNILVNFQNFVDWVNGIIV